MRLFMLIPVASTPSIQGEPINPLTPIAPPAPQDKDEWEEETFELSEDTPKVTGEEILEEAKRRTVSETVLAAFLYKNS